MVKSILIMGILLSSCSKTFFPNSKIESKAIQGYEISNTHEKWFVKGYTMDPITFYGEDGEFIFVSGEVKIKPVYKH